MLIDEGFEVYGVDASARMVEVFRKRFPDAHAECAAVENSDFFRRPFDGVVAWGLVFLLPPDVQVELIPKIARILNPGGKLLFTAPTQERAWQDALTGRVSRVHSEASAIDNFCRPRALFWMAKSRTKETITTTWFRNAEPPTRVSQAMGSAAAQRVIWRFIIN